MKYEYITVLTFDVDTINIMYTQGWEPMFSSVAKEYIVFTLRREIVDEQK